MTIKNLYSDYVSRYYGTFSTSQSRNLPPFEQQLKDFCKFYNANARPSNKRYARVDYRYPDYFVDPYRADVMSYEQSVRYNSIPMYEVDLPIDSLEKIVQNENEFIHRKVDFEWVDQMREKERLESFIRSNNLAVKKAYEKYSMLLNLVKDQYK